MSETSAPPTGAADRDTADRDTADRGTADRGTARGAQTRQLILDTALRLFREQGYGRTTMRAIAREAGVAVGNAYYYFPSKEHLIQEFYLGVQAEHRAAVAGALREETGFAARLRAVLHAGIDANAPYHGFAATFFKTAAEPTSPLSPFAAESAAPRRAAVELFREVVEGSTVRVDRELRGELPELLWLAYLGVILYWVHDRSPDQSRTRLLIDGAVPLIDRLVGLSRLPGLRSVTREALGLIRALRQ